MTHLRATARPAATALALAVVCALVLIGCGNETPQALVASGKQYLDKREPKGAVIQFKAALQQRPDSAETRYLLGRALLDSGDPVSAAAELAKALDLRHPETQVLPQLAQALLLAGENKKLTSLYGALELPDKTASASLKSSVAAAWGALGDQAKTQAAVQAALAAVPDFPAALVLKARLVAGAGDFNQAQVLVDQVLAKVPTAFEAWNLKGEILLLGKNNPKAAEAAFRRTLAIEKTHVAAHVSLIAMRMRENDLPGMRKQIQDLKAVLPGHPQTVFAEAQLAFLERDFKKAREASQLLLRGSPDNVMALMLAGAIEGQSGSLVQAEALFAKASRLDPDLELARRNLANTYLRMGQPDKALHVLAPLLEGDAIGAEALSVAAEAYLQLGDPRKAETLFIRASKIDPSNARVRTALALTRLARGDAPAAFAELNQVAIEDKGTFAEMAVVSARMKRKEYDAALLAANAMAKKQPDSVAVLNLRGQIQMLRNDIAAARQDLDAAHKLDPAYFPAVANLAAVDVLEKKPAVAQKRFEEVIQANPRNFAAYMALAALRQTLKAPKDEVVGLLTKAIQGSPDEPGPRLQLIEMRLRAKDIKDALAAAQDSVAALPNDVLILDALGRVQMESGNVQQAMGTFRRLINLDSKAPLPHTRLADLFIATRDYKSAEASLRRALELQPNLEGAQRSLLQIFLTDARLRDALDVAKQMQVQRPEQAMGYLSEGVIQMRMKAPEAAIAAYRAGLQQVPGHSELATRLHRTLVASGHKAEAEQFSAEWSKLHPDDLLFEYHRAITALAAGDLAQAETRLRAVVERQPDNGMALNNLAWTMATLGRKGAVAYAEKATTLLPNRPAVMDTLALALVQEGNLPRALELQKKVVALAPDDMGMRLNLAKIAISAGDKTLARTELERLAKEGTRFASQDRVAALMKKL